MEDTVSEQELTGDDSVSLGGNIQLKGFKKLETAKQIVAKKIIGNYVREIQEKKSDYENLSITLEGEENNATIKAELKAGGNNIQVSDSKENVFMALDSTLKKILEML
jgi:ribosome-associated translation inhibitor RaiA